MGIKGLLPAIKPVLKSAHISEFSGKRCAVDGYGWLHKAVYGCSTEMCRGTSKNNDTWVNYCLHFIDLLLFHKLDVIVVFDGAELPSKKRTETERENTRQANMQKADDLMKKGDISSARNYYSQAIDITPRMAGELIQVIRRSRPSVKCLVSPFEADAQLSYLSINNIVDVIISEDSDNIPYGCKDIIFKLAKDGSCQRLLLQDIYEKDIENFDMRDFSQDMVITMCILSGCDYLESAKGIGLKTAYKLVKKHRSTINTLKAMRLDGQLPLLPATNVAGRIIDASEASSYIQYEIDFYQAMLTFLHQVIFDPINRKTIFRTSVSKDILPIPLQTLFWPNHSTEFEFAGILLEDTIACGIADGLLDPVTKQPFNFPQYMDKRILNHSDQKGGSTKEAAKVKTSTSSQSSTTAWSYSSSLHSKINKASSSVSSTKAKGTIVSYFSSSNSSSSSAVVSRNSSFSQPVPSGRPLFFQSNFGAMKRNAFDAMTDNGQTSSKKQLLIPSTQQKSFGLKKNDVYEGFSFTSSACKTPLSTIDLTDTEKSSTDILSSGTGMTDDRISRYFQPVGDSLADRLGVSNAIESPVCLKSFSLPSFESLRFPHLPTEDEVNKSPQMDMYLSDDYEAPKEKISTAAYPTIDLCAFVCPESGDQRKPNEVPSYDTSLSPPSSSHSKIFDRFRFQL